MKIFGIFLVVVSALCAPCLALAEAIDRGALQELFGEPVTTSAIDMPQRIRAAPANMAILTADEIRRSGLRNIPQIIGEYVRGMDIFQSGMNLTRAQTQESPFPAIERQVLLSLTEHF